MALVAVGSGSQSGMTRKHVDMSHSPRCQHCFFTQPKQEREQRVVMVICKYEAHPTRLLTRLSCYVKGLELQRLLADV